MPIELNRVGPLWGTVVQPGVIQTVSLSDFELVITRAALANPTDHSVTPPSSSLRMRFTMKPGSPLALSPATEIIDITLCTLVPRQVEFSVLNLCIPSFEQVVFEVVGPKAICLLGNFTVPSSYRGLGHAETSSLTTAAQAMAMSRPASTIAPNAMKAANHHHRKRGHDGTGESGTATQRIKIESGSEPHALSSRGPEPRAQSGPSNSLATVQKIKIEPGTEPHALSSRGPEPRAQSGPSGATVQKIKIEPGTEHHALSSRGPEPHAQSRPSTVGSAVPKIDLNVKPQVIRNDIKVGEGQLVERGSTISVNFLGQVKNSKVIFAQVKSEKGVTFKVGDKSMLPGFDIGVVGMRVGGTRTLVVPPSLAFGSMGKPAKNGNPGVPPDATVLITVDVLSAE